MANEIVFKSGLKTTNLKIGTYAFPSSVGTQNQILSVNGSGNLEFIDNSGGSAYTGGTAIDITSNVVSVKYDTTALLLNGSNELTVGNGDNRKFLMGQGTSSEAVWNYVDAIRLGDGTIFLDLLAVASDVNDIQLNANNHRLVLVSDPINDQDAATKKYVDDAITAIPGSTEVDGVTLTDTGGTGNQLAVAGGLTNQLLVGVTGDDASWQFVSALYDGGGSLVFYFGGTTLNAAGYKITALGEPTGTTDATTKNYVDTELATKLSAVVDDLDPHLGGNLVVGSNSIVAGPGNDLNVDIDEGNYFNIGTMKTMSPKSIPATEVTPNVEYTFEFTFSSGIPSTYVDYTFTSSVGSRMGTLFVLSDGTNVSITDMGTELGTPSIEFTASIATGTTTVLGTSMALVAPQDLRITTRQM